MISSQFAPKYGSTAGYPLPTLFPRSPAASHYSEGDKAVNFLPLLRTVVPVFAIQGRNDFPVEGATGVFTLPASGPGGTFA